ncbi:hypothetical protein LNQ52_12580 [Klebsiella pneumoniae subsp. pneumoniae]|nr:hypothetical protein [Klebsiella pneumoniae subsp. pneumoniae]
MDIWLFITSSSAIAPCFSACAHAGKSSGIAVGTLYKNTCHWHSL